MLSQIFKTILTYYSIRYVQTSYLGSALGPLFQIEGLGTSINVHGCILCVLDLAIDHPWIEQTMIQLSSAQTCLEELFGRNRNRNRNVGVDLAKGFWKKSIIINHNHES